jgi:hypothetical protein
VLRELNRVGAAGIHPSNTPELLERRSLDLGDARQRHGSP